MKRIIVVMMALVMSLSVFVGCVAENDKPVAANIDAIIKSNDVHYNETYDIDFDIEVDDTTDPDTTIMADNHDNAGADDDGNITNNDGEISNNSGEENANKDDSSPVIDEVNKGNKNDQNNADNAHTSDDQNNENVEQNGKPAEATKPAHVHNYQKNTIGATCTENGYTKNVCSCGDFYVNNKVTALGHNYQSIVTSPKVGSEGYTTHTCQRCGDRYIDSYVDALMPETEPDPTEPHATEPPVTEPEKNNNAPYDGDTAVPPDVNDTVIETPKCENHDMVLINTTIDTEYQLYNYVTDHYKCSNCDYSESNVHMASANLSAGQLNSIESQIVAYVNNLRAENGLTTLWTDGSWNDWANTRAIELDSAYGHNRPNGGSWMTCIGSNITIGENIAVGHASGYAFFNAFCNSAQHRSIMMSEDAIGIAVGLFVDSDGNTYCAMILIG